MARRPGPVRPRVKDAKAYETAVRGKFLNPFLRDIEAKLERVQSLNAAQQVLKDQVDAVSGLPHGGVPVDTVRQQIALLNGYHRARIQKAFTAALGVDVRPLLSETAVLSFLSQRIDTNVGLIRTIPKRFHDGLASKMRQQFFDAPFDQNQLMNLVAKEGKSAGYNLRRIIRDQTSKTIGGLTEIRHKQLGIENYEWVTAGDERVRPSHQANGGVVFKWSDPPANTGHPGSDVQCRCVALGVIQTETVEQLTTFDKQPEPGYVHPLLQPQKPVPPPMKPPKPK